MFVYFDETSNPFKGISPRLYERQMAELDKGAAEFGIFPVGSVKDGIHVDTRGCRSAAQLQQWLAAVGAVTITAEPSDVACLFDHQISNPEALQMLHEFPKEHFRDLLPDELSERTRQAALGVYDYEPIDENTDIGQAQIAAIEKDFKAAGIELPPAGSRLELNIRKDSDASAAALREYGITEESNPFYAAPTPDVMGGAM